MVPLGGASAGPPRPPGYQALDLEAAPPPPAAAAAAGSPLLDANGDVANSSAQPLQHYRSIGDLEREQQLIATQAPQYYDYYSQQYSTTKRGRLQRVSLCVFGVLLLVFVVAAGSVTLQRHFSSSSSSSSDTGGLAQQPSNSSSLATRESAGPQVAANAGSTFVSSSSSTGSSSTAGSSSAAGGGDSVWHEGGGASTRFEALAQPRNGADAVACVGPDLQCGVVNRLPVPEADFRGLPRRVVARRGVVAADSSRCSQIGRDVLAGGGNAVDAAVATALCQGVVNPMSSGMGGGAFISVRLANGSAAFWDARETAPGAASRDMYNGLPANASLFGGLAVAVPGELQGLEAAWRRFGTQPWASLVQPAASLARSGFAAHPYLVNVLSGASTLQRVMATPGLREAFLIKSKQGWRAPHVGELCCRRPALADTLDKIAAQGAAYLISPRVTAAHAAELAAAGGIITAADLAGAAPVERQLLRVPLGELELLVPPPPSSAAVVAFMLRFLAGYGNTLQSISTSGSIFSESFRPRNSSSSSSKPTSFTAAAVDGGLGLHRLVEASKHGFAVRTALGDPGAPGAAKPFPGAPSILAAVNDLLYNASFVEELRAMTADDGVLEDRAYGGRWNPEGVAPPQEHGTSHLSIVDDQRNAVSMTTSINTVFGSGVVSATTGILFGNTMDDFASPSKRTLVTPHPSVANFIAPGKRPLSAMSPIIVTHRASGRLVAVAGASGGPLIVSATAQTLARLLLEGVDVEDAVSGPRLHDQLLPRHDVYYENVTWGHTVHVVAPKAVTALQARRQTTTPAPIGVGVAQAVVVEYSGGGGGGGGGSGRSSSRGVLMARSDERKDGAPAAF